MNDLGMFLSVDGLEAARRMRGMRKHGLPVLTITERYFGDGAPGYTESATI